MRIRTFLSALLISLIACDFALAQSSMDDLYVDDSSAPAGAADSTSGQMGVRPEITATPNSLSWMNQTDWRSVTLQNSSPQFSLDNLTLRPGSGGGAFTINQGSCGNSIPESGQCQFSVRPAGGLADASSQVIVTSSQSDSIRIDLDYQAKRCSDHSPVSFTSAGQHSYQIPPDRVNCVLTITVDGAGGGASSHAHGGAGGRTVIPFRPNEAGQFTIHNGGYGSGGRPKREAQHGAGGGSTQLTYTSTSGQSVIFAVSGGGGGAGFGYRGGHGGGGNLAGGNGAGPGKGYGGSNGTGGRRGRTIPNDRGFRGVGTNGGSCPSGTICGGPGGVGATNRPPGGSGLGEGSGGKGSGDYLGGGGGGGGYGGGGGGGDYQNYNNSGGGGGGGYVITSLPAQFPGELAGSPGGTVGGAGNYGRRAYGHGGTGRVMFSFSD